MQVTTEVPVPKLRWRGGRVFSGRDGECRVVGKVSAGRR